MAILWYPQAQEVRQLENQIGFLNRFVIPNKHQILLGGLNENSRPDSMSFCQVGQTSSFKCREHSDSRIERRSSENSLDHYNSKYFSESLGKSKQISTTFRTFKLAFRSKFFENFALPGI